MSGQVDLSKANVNDAVTYRDGRTGRIVQYDQWANFNRNWMSHVDGEKTFCRHRKDGTYADGSVSVDDIIRVTPAPEPAEPVYPNAGYYPQAGRYRTGEIPQIGDVVKFVIRGDGRGRWVPEDKDHSGNVIKYEGGCVMTDAGHGFSPYAARFDLVSRAAPSTPAAPPADDPHAHWHEFAAEIDANNRIVELCGIISKPYTPLAERLAALDEIREALEPGEDDEAAPAAEEVDPVKIISQQDGHIFALRAEVADLQRQLADVRDALWVCMEHNRLYHGDNHNTVIQAEKALDGWKPSPSAAPSEPAAGPVITGELLADAMAAIKGAMRIVDCWGPPSHGDPEHSNEDAALHSMRCKFESLIARFDTIAPPPPPPTLLEAAQAVVEGIERTPCTCNTAFTARGRIDPNCHRCGLDLTPDELAALRDAVQRELAATR